MIAPRYANADPTENLMPDRPRPRRIIIDTDRGPIIATKKRHDVTAPRFGGIRYVDHALIHRHASDERRAYSMDQHETTLAVRPRKSIGVADRDERYAHPARHLVRLPISDRRSGRYVLNAQDASAEGNGRNERRGSRDVS